MRFGLRFRVKVRDGRKVGGTHGVRKLESEREMNKGERERERQIFSWLNNITNNFDRKNRMMTRPRTKNDFKHKTDFKHGSRWMTQHASTQNGFTVSNYLLI